MAAMKIRVLRSLNRKWKEHRIYQMHPTEQRKRGRRCLE
jgi:hypothetical protein